MIQKILAKTILVYTGFIFQAYSQDMFVKSNSFLYISDQYVYVTKNIELNTSTSNIYLRNDGQLLQGTTGVGSNKGLGTLSVFQEGTVNNFQYNYWCSPVGNANSSTSVNNPFGIVQFGIPTSVTNTTPVTILDSYIYDGTASPFAIAPYWIYKFSVNSSYSDWVHVGAASTINAGEGFTMKGTSGTDTTVVNGIKNNPDGRHQRYDFRGKPNDGTIEIPVLPNELTLTGNPYPSAINLQDFLNEELNCTGVAYFWEHDKMVNSHYLADYKGGYGTYSAIDIYIPAIFYTYDGAGNQVTNIGSSGNIFKRKYSPIGQGFMIEGAPLATGNVQMKNSYRIFIKEDPLNKSEFERIANKKTNTSDEAPQIRFNTLIDNGPISQMVVLFDPTSTDDADRAKDAAYQNDGPANSFFVINDKEYVINVLPFDIDKKIPIGFRNSAQANYKITINEMLNIPEVANVYIHDKTTDTYYDIKNNLFDLTLPAGTYNTQYEITFKDNTTLGVNDLKNKIFLIQQNNVNKNLTINNPSQLEISNCSLYDVVGKLIFSKDKLGTDASYTFSTAGLRDGLYIVKLITDDKVTGTKIVVKN